MYRKATAQDKLGREQAGIGVGGWCKDACEQAPSLADSGRVVQVNKTYGLQPLVVMRGDAEVQPPPHPVT